MLTKRFFTMVGFFALVASALKVIAANKSLPRMKQGPMFSRMRHIGPLIRVNSMSTGN